MQVKFCGLRSEAMHYDTLRALMVRDSNDEVFTVISSGHNYEYGTMIELDNESKMFNNMYLAVATNTQDEQLRECMGILNSYDKRKHITREKWYDAIGKGLTDENELDIFIMKVAEYMQENKCEYYEDAIRHACYDFLEQETWIA